jgi:hypothetical protein
MNSVRQYSYLREIEVGMARIPVHGGRMDAKQMDQIGRD